MKSTKIILNKEVTKASLPDFAAEISTALSNNEDIELVVEEGLEIDDNVLSLILLIWHQCFQKNRSVIVRGGGDILPDIINFFDFENTVTFG